MQNRIGILRRAKKMSQAELAAAVGTTRSQINRLEHGDRRLSLDWMARIARVLEVKLSELLPADSAASPAAPVSPEEEILQIVALLPEKDQLMLVGIAREILRRATAEGETDAAPAPEAASARPPKIEGG